MVGVTVSIRGAIQFEAACAALGNGGIRKVARSAVTILAQDFAKEIAEELPTIFDRPTPFTKRGMSYDKAGSGPAVARTFVRDRQSRYLLMQETGGVRKRGQSGPAGGRELPLSGKDATVLDQYGGLKRRIMSKRIASTSGNVGKSGARAGTKVYFSPKKGIRYSAGDEPLFGLFVRTKRTAKKRKAAAEELRKAHRPIPGPKGRRGRVKGNPRWGLRQLVSFKDQVDYEPIFGFHDKAQAFGDRRAAELIGRLTQKEISRRLAAGRLAKR